MRKLFLLLFLCINITLAQKTDLDKYISGLIKEAEIPGLSIAVIKNNKIDYVKNFGVISNDTKIPVTNETVFAAASLSKVVFSYAVLQLVEEGKFELDNPLYEYLEYEDIKDDDRYKKITARMVLSHSSGFPNWRNQNLEILFNPGEQFSYSGEGFVYLQKVVEKITKQSLEEFASERVFTPLEMTHTSYVWKKEFEKNFAIPHDDFGITQKKYKPEEPNAAHSLQTTAEDYAKFILAINTNTGLSSGTIDQMLTPQIKAAKNISGKYYESELVSWGLGVGLQKTTNGMEFWHWGDNGTFKCYFTSSKEKGKAVVYFTNSGNGLSITPYLVKKIMGTEQPSCDWNNYEKYDSPSRTLFRDIMTEGFDKAISPFLNGQNKLDTTLITEGEINQVGYSLLFKKRIFDAKKVFVLNAAAFPSSSNVYDSYGEACLVNGEFDLAAENYLKAFQMNPGNKRAKRISEQILNPVDGNTTFKVKGYSEAKMVSLAGEFNEWDQTANLFLRKDGEWICELNLEPGTYKYKFVVDGIWIIDESNPKVDFDGQYYNSVIEIK